jgi:hypothetical protein
VRIPNAERIGKAGRDAPAIRCVHLADDGRIAQALIEGAAKAARARWKKR